MIHVVTDRLEDLTPLLDQVGEMHFPHRRGRADAATHGGGSAPHKPSERARSPKPRPSGPGLPETIRVKSRNFH